MDTKRMVALAVVVLLLAGCGGAKYTEEKTMLSVASGAMETFASSIEQADSPMLIAQALSAFSNSLEGVLPAMKKMKAEHADWETAPPEALKDAFAQFKSASEKFRTAMPKVMEIAGQHTDNAALQGAVAKFRDLVVQL